MSFPPIDELFRWKDVAFNDSPFAINKTAILMLASAFLIVVIFVGGSRKMKMVPSGTQNVLEMTYEFVDGGITRDVVGQDATRYTPFLGSLFLFILFCNFWEVIPFIQFPPTARHRGCPFYLAHPDLRHLSGRRVQEPRAQVPHRAPVPAGRAEGPLHPRDADRVRRSCSWCGRSRWQSDSSPT